MKQKTQNKQNIYKDKEMRGVYRMKLSTGRFVEYLGGEFTIWDGRMDSNGVLKDEELKNPQRITSEVIKELKEFISFIEREDSKIPSNILELDKDYSQEPSLCEECPNELSEGQERFCSTDCSWKAVNRAQEETQ